MSNEELLDAILLFFNEIKRDVPQKIEATATVNRGMCAGSVSYAAKPVGEANAGEIMRLLLDAYYENGVEIDAASLASNEGAERFVRVFLEAVKSVVSENRIVNLVDRLRFEPRLYTHDPSNAWMCPIPCSAEFNRLPSKVELAQSPAFITRKKREATKKPFDKAQKAAQAKTAGRHTTVVCPNCGEEITIENTQE